MTRRAWGLVVVVALGGCARQSDVNRVELQVRRLREETARADSARAVLLDQIIVSQKRILDSLAVQERRLLSVRGDIRADLTEVQRQLVQIQELMGQTQGRLTEMRGQMEARNQALTQAARQATSDTGAANPASSGPPPDLLYSMSLQQLQRGSPATARIGFERLLQDFPQHERAGDAQFFIGETFGMAAPDSAMAAYDRLITNYPTSPRIPSALFKLGQLAEIKKDKAAARQYYNRLITGFPRSDEANLAKDKLQALGK